MADAAGLLRQLAIVVPIVYTMRMAGFVLRGMRETSNSFSRRGQRLQQIGEE